MSSNLKNSNVAVRLLLGHGEKLWILGIVACAVLLVWSALGRERLPEDKTPEKLKSLISTANTHIANSRWEDAPPEIALRAENISVESMKAVSHDHFPKFDVKFDMPVLAPVQKRTDPELLAVVNLEAYGDSGILATSTAESRQAKRIAAATEAAKAAKEDANNAGRRRNDLFENGGGQGVAGNAVAGKGGVIIQRPSTGSQLRGLEDTNAESWVSLVAKIPVKDQYLRYENALVSTRGYNPSVDIPTYRGYIVKRAEVTNTGEGEWIKVATVSEKKILSELENTVSRSNNLIDTKYSHPLLTFPLPSLLLREWDRKITHTQIPFLEDERKEREKAAAEPIASETDAGGDDPFGGPLRRGNSRVPNRMNESVIREREEVGAGGVVVSGEEAGAATGLPLYRWDRTTEYLLFRYIDKTAQPGKKYRYKVQLVLADVNYEADESNLDKTVIDRWAGKKSTFRFSPESEPSPIVSVPQPARVYLASMNKVVREADYNSEPQVELLVKSYEGNIAAEVARLEPISRGQVMNVTEPAKVIWSNTYSSDEKAEFNFNTGIMLLDATGGQSFSGRKSNIAVPVRAVLMDSSGRMFVQSQVDDSETVANFNNIIESAEASNSTNRREDDEVRGNAGDRPPRRPRGNRR